MCATFVTFLELKSQDLNTAERVSPNRFSYRGVHKIYNLESYTSASLFFSRFVFHNLRSMPYARRLNSRHHNTRFAWIDRVKNLRENMPTINFVKKLIMLRRDKTRRLCSDKKIARDDSAEKLGCCEWCGPLNASGRISEQVLSSVHSKGDPCYFWSLLHCNDRWSLW